MKITVSDTTEAIMAEIARLEGLLAEKAGEGLLVWSGLLGRIRETPKGGAKLTVEWAVSDQSTEEWYPSTEAAMAELHRIARDHGSVVDGWRVDLTSPGRHSSTAWVTRL